MMLMSTCVVKQKAFTIHYCLFRINYKIDQILIFLGKISIIQKILIRINFIKEINRITPTESIKLAKQRAKLRINVLLGIFIGAFIDFIKEINRITLTDLIKLVKKRADIT